MPARASSPGPMARGIDSPVKADVSIEVSPPMTKLSRGTRSPGLT